MSDDLEISNKILELVRTANPETVDTLIELAEKKLNVKKEIALKHVIELEKQKKLKFISPSELMPKKLSTYLFTMNAYWFWMIIVSSILTIITVYTTPENTPPYVYIRFLLGSIFILLLPGFSLIKALFPTREISSLERIVLSVGMSIVLVPLVGLILIYTPWGITLTHTSLSLLVVTTFLAVIGLLREYYEKVRDLDV